MYKVVGGQDIKDYHLFSWNKKEVTLKPDAFKEVSSPEVHAGAVQRALNKIEKAGPVGIKLVIFAKASKDLEIVCWPGVPGEFICAEELPQSNVYAPTIMWDPYKCFEYYGRVEKTSTKAALNPAIMPAWMVLAHEIGHFYHYRHENSWYVSALRNGDIAGIERRNLKDHEQPMLKAAGYPVRSDYQDFKGGSGEQDKHITINGTFPHPNPNFAEKVPGNLQRDIIVLNGKIQQARAEETRKKADRLKGTGIEDVCDKCGEKFPSQFKLNMHRLKCKG